jgi:hypothetical protein
MAANAPTGPRAGQRPDPIGAFRIRPFALTVRFDHAAADGVPAARPDAGRPAESA